MKLILLTIMAAAMAASAEETSVADLLQKGNDQFTAKMFSEVVKDQPGKSVVLSAFSVLTPLAQLSFAASGASHDELLRAIGLPNDNATKEVFGLINRSLRSVKGVDLRMASRVYVEKDAQLKDEFQSLSRDYFGSDVRNVDFTESQKTAGEINSWVEDQTNHRIKDLVDPSSLDGNTRAVLVNAIYFKGKWSKPFDAKNTQDLDFHVTKDKTVKVPTMSMKGEFEYTESQELDAKILRMYYEGGQASMLIVLPNKIDGLAELEKKLQDPEALSKATRSMYNYEVNIKLPKFKIETTTDLKKVLVNIGVNRIFSPVDAHLDNMLKESSDLFVSEAKQKAFIEVNEEGAEAAAGNVAIHLMSPSVPIIYTPFIADRPFYYQLEADNVLIFNGVLHF